MTNFCIYLCDQHAILSNFIFQDSLESEESKEAFGAKRLARMKLLGTESTMMSLMNVFRPFIDISLPQFKMLSQEPDPEQATVRLEAEEEESFSMNEPNDKNEVTYETDSDNDVTDEECASDDDGEAFVALI